MTDGIGAGRGPVICGAERVSGQSRKRRADTYLLSAGSYPVLQRAKGQLCVRRSKNARAHLGVDGVGQVVRIAQRRKTTLETALGGDAGVVDDDEDLARVVHAPREGE